MRGRAMAWLLLASPSGERFERGAGDEDQGEKAEIDVFQSKKSPGAEDGVEAEGANEVGLRHRCS